MTPDELTGVTTSVEHGAARGVIAHHIGVTSIRIAPGIRLDGTAERQFTRQVVEVYPANGAINIARDRSSPGQRGYSGHAPLIGEGR